MGFCMQFSVVLGAFAFFFLPFIVDAAMPACDDLNPAFVCGVKNVEDLVRLEGTPWVVSNQVAHEYGVPTRIFGLGALQTIRIDTHRVHRLYPTSDSRVDWDRKMYPDCAMPPQNLASSGLHVRALGEKRFRLFVANHGDRESIEIIDVAVHGEWLSTAWRGCILAPKRPPPEGVWPNSVAVLPDAGVVLSGFNVAIWRSGLGWTYLNHLKFGLSNGVEVSRDGRWLLVADTKNHSVTRVSVRNWAVETVITLDFAPDNLRWGEDGHLYLAGQYVHSEDRQCQPSEKSIASLASSSADMGFAIAQIDPDAPVLIAKEVYRSDNNRIMGTTRGGIATVALQVGDDFWIGPGRGDRITIIPLRL